MRYKDKRQPNTPAKGKKLQLMKKFCSGFLALSMILLSVQSVAAEENHHYSYYVDTDKITIYDTNLSGINGNTPGKVDFQQSVDALKDSADPVAVKKYAYYDESVADGFMKIDIDYVSQDHYLDPIDVLFVLDQSGSMNMMSNNELANGATTSKYTTPCLNKDHYYRVPVKTQVNVDGKTVWKAFWYYFKPSEIKGTDDKSAIDTWETRAFINAIKNAFFAEMKKNPEYAGQTFSVDTTQLNHLSLSQIGLTSTADYMTLDFDDAHYKMKTTGGAVIFDAATDTSADQEAVFEKLNNTDPDSSKDTRYYSPQLNNTNGCSDRMMYSRLATSEFSQKLLDNDHYLKNRVGLVTFAGSVVESCEFTSAYDDLKTASLDLQGRDYTSYIAALTEAKKILTDDKSTEDRQRYVIFVTDGKTTDSSADSATKISSLASDIRGEANLVCVGISLSSDAFSSIQNLASDDGNGGKLAYNCESMEDFSRLLESFYNRVNIESPKITDIVGSAFELYCDAEHPLSFTWVDSSTKKEATKTFASLEEAKEEGVAYDTDNNTLTWDTEKFSATAVRLSFYQKLQPDQVGDNTGEEYRYKTNESASVTYVQNGEEKTSDVPTPAEMVMDKSILTAKLTCDVPDGTTINNGDDLTYTITLTNTGTVDLTKVSVYDPIPKGTQFLSCDSNGTLREDKSGVDFLLEELKAGQSASVSFKVKVMGGKNRVVTDTATFGLKNATASFAENGDPICTCETIRHYLPADQTASTSSDSGTTTGNGPKTGDTSNSGLWILLAVLAVGGVAAVLLIGRKKK